MHALSKRWILALCLAAAPASAEEWTGLPEEWRVDGTLRVHGELEGGGAFSLPEAPVRAHVILDAEAGRFGVSIRDAGGVWLLQVGALAQGAHGQPRLAPDDLFERGLVERACAELRSPPPCDRPLYELGVAIAESSARARADGGELRLAGRLRLVVFDPQRPGPRIRLAVAWAGRGEPKLPALLAATD